LVGLKIPELVLLSKEKTIENGTSRGGRPEIEETLAELAE